MMDYEREIEILAAIRRDLVAKRNACAKRYVQSNGLFGDTQADEGGLFPEANFMSEEYTKRMIDIYDSQIKRIDAKIEALRKAQANIDTTEQTTIKL